jgi:GxxExxY protein
MNTDIQMKPKQEKLDLVHSQESFKIIGVLFQVYNDLGYGHAEKIYQKAVATGLKNIGLAFEEQVYAPVYFQGEIAGKGYLDFLIEGIVILELKKGDRYSKNHIDQVYQYLRAKNLKLGILAYFTAKKVHLKRIVNLNP